ncbi:MAG: T9SS type A sorting domain-containing protein, partial [Ignavibacteriae bacterium]|nr:T9SS type A sorting domain-containing protein [Ignavibacteriota bacterium]
FLRENIYYDKDGQHIYAVTKKNDHYFLFVSDNYGNKNSWTLLYTTNSKLTLSLDEQVSGTFNFAAKNKIYQSIDFGQTFNIIHQLGQNIVGIFTVPNSDTIYAATRFAIWEITSTSLTPIKQVIPEESLSYYPLHVGDYWEYQVTMRGEGPYENDEWIGYKRVIGDSVLSNNKKYFIVQSNRVSTQNNDAIYTQLIRLDSSKGNVYQYDYNGQDILIDSLFMEVNDSVGYECKVLSNIYYKDVFGKNVKTRFYEHTCSTLDNMQLNYELSQGFGEIHRNYSYAPVTNIDFQYSLVYTKINGIEYGIKTAVENNPKTLPAHFSLSQNYPNPFNPTTTIEYSVPSSEFVSLKFYDVLGREVATLINQSQKPGIYKTVWNATNFASGIYYYSLKTNNKILSKKMLHLK